MQTQQTTKKMWAVLTVALGVMGAAVPARAQSPVPNPKDNQTIITANGMMADVTIKVNGKTVPPAPAAYLKWTDISDKVRPGRNTVDVSVSRITPSGVYVKVSHAPTAGKFREIARFSPSLLQKKEKNYTFTFTLAGSSDADSGKGKAPVAGSGEKQTIIKVATNSPMTVYINDKKIGEYNNSVTLDVSNAVQPGENNLRVVWPKPATASSVRVAYAATKNKFHEIGNVLIGLNDGSKPGEKTVTFAVPE